MIQHTSSEISISQVTKNIWVGNQDYCLMNGKKIKGFNFDAEIDIAEETIPVQSKVGKIYLWLPTKDRTAPTPEQIKIAVSTLKNLVADNKKVYVHCRYGMGRSPLIIACYLISTGLSQKEAMNLLMEKRPETSFTEIQEQALKQYAKGNS